MSKFKNWYVENQDAITWFVIGLLVTSGFVHLSQEKYGWALFDFALAGLNFAMGRTRLK